MYVCTIRYICELNKSISRQRGIARVKFDCSLVGVCNQTNSSQTDKNTCP